MTPPTSISAPSACPVHLLAKSARNFDPSAYLREWLADAAKPKGDVRLEVHIDPMSFL